MKHVICLLVIILALQKPFAQNSAGIPGYTGYALPSEGDNDEAMFNDSAGLRNWTNPHQEISYYFKTNESGKLSIALLAKNNMGSAAINVLAAGQIFTVTIPKSKTFKEIPVGEISVIKETGYYQIALRCVKKTSKNIADIQAVQLTGSIINKVHFNAKVRRNAASVHLMYPLPDSIKAVAFYNEVTVPKGTDIPYSYFMACGFARGYFGIQVNSKTERRVIFSVWDAGNEAVDRNKVADTNRVKLVAKGDGVYAADFGNEGTGGHSHLLYNWRADSTYKFLVTALPDSATHTTTYSGYFYATELKAWKFIASFRAPKDGESLHHLYSFLEDFVGSNGEQYRKAFYNNAWVQDEDGQWTELPQATFSCDVTGRAGDRTDFGGGVENNKFYLWNGGFKPPNAKYGDKLAKAATGQKPVVNLYNNVDSALQARLDIEIINKAVKDSVLDTTASVNGVYYNILAEGNGNKVSVNDTVSVFYKGWILNGDVFDSTGKETATFPLNRLIKGWQYALPQCKVGGKIRLIIPSGLAYSIRSRAITIPPNSILVFDIDVVGAKKASRG
ncbi:MAG TPA: DUF3472 domain-containing protein [Chitinophagaceae bacterium]|nr:DUF3472 domain-containing protein [Chitinophagaceae bacterium]